MKRNTKVKKPAMTPSDIDPSFAPVVAAFAKDRHVSRRKMFSSSSVLNVNGKIFAMLVRGKFVAKLPKDRVAELVSSGNGEYFDPGHGRLMKEWVAVGAGKALWVKLAKEAYRFVKGGE
jgi:TfoX/Sxy family transcriptional regulator of competence genes